MIQKGLRILLWSMVLLFLGGILWYTAGIRRNMVCAEVRVEVVDSTDHQFIKSSNLRNWVRSNYGSLLNRKLDALDLRKIEEGVRKFRSIEEVWVYPSVVGGTSLKGGALVVRVKQREPILRVVTSGRDYYVDRTGSQFDWIQGYVPRVMIVTGYVTPDYLKKKLIPLVSFISEDSFWSAQIEQIDVSKSGKITMIPKIGEHKIYFGYADDFKIKFRNLKSLYESGFEGGRWGYYQSISLEFRNQIVCTKKS